MIENMSGQGEKPSDISIQDAGGLVDLNSPLFKAVLPLLKHLDPVRAAAVLQATARIELIHKEGVVMMMPEIFIIR
ncbi:MAG: hypothetical protein ACYTBV_20650 [Planctomycetota bacterium]|jgi:hypothetical protein